MAKTFKRAIAVLLSVLMIATTLPFTAFASSSYISVNDKAPVYSDDMGSGYAKLTQQYDGVNGFKSINEYNGYGDGTAYTIEFLVNPGNDITDSAIFNIGEVNSGGARYYLELHENGDFRYVWDIDREFNETSFIDGNDSNKFFSGLTANQWVTVDMVITAEDNHDIIKMYINGNLVNTINDQVFQLRDGRSLCKYLQNSHSVWFGRNCGYWQNASDGYIDNFCVYDYAKTDAEIKKAYTSAGKFREIVTPGFYNNLLYSSDNTVWCGDNSGNDKSISFGGSNSTSCKVALSEKVVALYDGKNDVYFPIKVEATYANQNRYTSYLKSETPNYSIRSNWYMTRKTDDGDAWAHWNLDKSVAEIGYAENHLANFDYNVKNTNVFYLNKCYYDGTVNTDSYYETLNTMAISLHYDSRSNGDANNTYGTITNNRINYYIINYKPIADIYGSIPAWAESLKAEVASKPVGYYTNANEIDNVANAILTLNPNDYDYAADTDNAVKACSADIKLAVEAYNNFELVKHTCVEGETKQENEVAPSGDKAGSHDEVVYCTICGEELSRNTVVDLSYEAYDDEVAVVDALDSTLYTDESWTDLQTAKTEAAADVLTATTQEEINAATAKLMTAVSNLKTKGYTVTVVVEKDGEPAGTITQSVEAGKVYTYTAEDAQIYKATVNDQRIVSDNEKFEIVVTSDITVNVYLASDVEVSDVYTVVYKGVNGITAAIKYVDDLKNIEHPVGPAIPFYGFSGWEYVNTVGKTVTYMAAYTPNYEDVESQCNIIGVDGVLVKGEGQYNAYYDEIVGFDAGGNKVGMYADENCTKLLGYVDSTFYLHAPHRDVVYVKAIEDADSLSASVGITGMYSYIDNAGMQTLEYNGNTFNAKGATEVGVLVSVNPAYAISATGFVEGTKGVKKAESTKITSIGEFTIAVHSNFGKYTTAYARPYVVVNGETIYGDVVTLEIAQPTQA